MKKWLQYGVASFSIVVLAGTLVYGAIADTGFADVHKDAWYAEAVQYCSGYGIISGMSDSVFAPEKEISRAMLASILYRYAGSPDITSKRSFEDIGQGDFYDNAAVWTAETGVINTIEERMFHGGSPVTREELAGALWQYAGRPASVKAASYADAGTIAPAYLTAVAWA